MANVNWCPRSDRGCGLPPIRPGRGGAGLPEVRMPSLGVRVPEVRRIVKAAAKQLPPGSCELQSTVLELWRGAGWREERYAAIDLTGLRLAAGERACCRCTRKSSAAAPGGT